MKDEDIERVHAGFEKWLDSQDNLLEIPEKEALGNAWHAAWETAYEEYRNEPCGGCQMTEALEDQVGEMNEMLVTENLEEEKLKARIEAMKCCGNCRNKDEPCKTAARYCTSWEFGDHGC